MRTQKSAPAVEVNFDGLVGPTHNYAGLADGNLASTTHKSLVSNPREAALQGLEKMKFLMDLGLTQGVLPPHERPHLDTLRALGFQGKDAEILEKARILAPRVLTAVSSASSMWTANAATVAPSADTSDGKVHFSPANLANKFHRSIEWETTGAVLKAIFKNRSHFVHHMPLPGGNSFGDEGAANHTRFCNHYENAGLHLFVYGRSAFDSHSPEPKKFPARQTFEASTAVARRHLLDSKQLVFAQQNPEAIDAGVFHNDVISVGNCEVFFYHEESFLNQDKILEDLRKKFNHLTGEQLCLVCVPSSEISLKDTVQSYLFNSQLISLPNNEMALIAPFECQTNLNVKKYLNRLIEDSSQPIRRVHFMDLRQSMQNGGGPACLRLRIVLTQKEIKVSNSKAYLTPTLYTRLLKWIQKHYRDRVSENDLSDPKLLQESRAALDELTQILKLGSIYSFQK